MADKKKIVCRPFVFIRAELDNQVQKGSVHKGSFHGAGQIKLPESSLEIVEN